MTTVLASLSSAALAGYPELRRRVKETLLEGQRKIEEARVDTYWKTGWYIQEYIRRNGGRAEFGKRTIEELSNDLHISYSVLQRCAQFAEKFPQKLILATRRELPGNPHQTSKSQIKNTLRWSHFRVLLPIEEEKVRLRLAEKAAHKGWTVPELEAKIKTIVSKSSRNTHDAGRNMKLLTPRRGTLRTFKILDSKSIGLSGNGLLFLDQGFKVYKERNSAQGRAAA